MPLLREASTDFSHGEGVHSYFLDLQKMDIKLFFCYNDQIQEAYVEIQYLMRGIVH
jgi:hypothetical protein